MNRLPLEKQTLILSLLSEGNSIRSIERMSGVHRDTIMRLAVSVGERCAEFMDSRMVNLKVSKLQVDEIYSYVGKHQHKLSKEQLSDQFIGEQYVFVPMDAETKLIPCFRLGKRTGQNARSIMMELRTRIVTRFQLSTDAFHGYLDAVDRVFGQDVDYGMLHKSYENEPQAEHRYSPGKIIRTSKRVMIGEPDRKHISTSYIERQNLTMRMSMRRFTRLTNAYSKKWENLKAALQLHFWYYNFARVHETLRVTPAMEAGISKHIWTWSNLLNYQAQEKAA
jgi:IS1 family transposase